MHPIFSLGVFVKSVRAHGSQTVAAVFDQGLISLGSLFFSVFIARSYSPALFSGFSVVVAAHVVVIGMQRGLIGDVLLIRYPKSKESGLLSASVLLSALFGALISIIAIVLSFVVVGLVGSILLAYSAAALFLCLQDALRYRSIAQGRLFDVVIADLLLCAAQVASALLIPRLYSQDGVFGVQLVLTCWGTAACLSAALLLFMTPGRPTRTSLRLWSREPRKLGLKLWADYLSYAATQQGATFFAAGITSVSAAGAIRGGQVLLGPLNVLSSGLGPIVLTRAAERAQSPSAIRLLCGTFGAVLLCLSVCVGLFIRLLPFEWGTQILGASWSLAAGVGLPIALATGLTSAGYAASIGLRARERVGLGLKVRAITLPLALLLVPLATYKYGLEGAVNSMVATSLVACILWWAFLLNDLSAVRSS